MANIEKNIYEEVTDYERLLLRIERVEKFVADQKKKKRKKKERREQVIKKKDFETRVFDAIMSCNSDVGVSRAYLRTFLVKHHHFKDTKYFRQKLNSTVKAGLLMKKLQIDENQLISMVEL